jgi:hypothetical protein
MFQDVPAPQQFPLRPPLDIPSGRRHRHVRSAITALFNGIQQRHLIRKRLRSTRPRRKRSITLSRDCAALTACVLLEKHWTILAFIMISRLSGRNTKMLAKLSWAANFVGMGAPQYKGARAKIAAPTAKTTTSQSNGLMKLLP